MLYLESSALVKRYVAEAGTRLVQAAIDHDPYVATALITSVEVRAALAAASRAGRVEDLDRLVAAFLNDWAHFIVIQVDQALIDSAGELAQRHALRGYDAVQLAAALVAAQSARSAEVSFLVGTFDADLHRAAVAEGLSVLK